MAGKFVIRHTGTGLKFDLKASNGEVILSSQVYASETTCKEGIESVRKTSAAAGIEDQTVEGFSELKHPKFEIYHDKGGEFRFRLKAKNGQIIGTSEGYKTRASCRNGVDSVIRNAAEAKIEEVLTPA